MQVMHDDDNNIIICNQSSGFFIIMSPAEGLHFSALVKVVVLASSGYKAKTAVTCILKLIFIYNYADNMTDVSMLNEKFLRISEQLDVCKSYVNLDAIILGILRITLIIIILVVVSKMCLKKKIYIIGSFRHILLNYSS